ncbi:hypothetical protein [Ulvibacter antarcticus]|uniref:C1q domain-containing protein n=1 Tax=Ulvibacter antarcticus TaxID=442714 RepID=A0A3L9YCG2_9FLAO|nr:hypothetical protein [Ulvibacter antarcticus]RMA58054.1 hypothetical protein BXY75_2862 [Ulvibacter antarcticus]
MYIKAILFLLVSLPLFSQVGIGITSPTATLDINGDLRIRNTTQETEIEIAKDSMLVISRNGTVNRISSKTVVSSALRTAVKGNFSSTGLISLSLVSNTALLTFNDEEFDLNNEFNTTTSTFTAKQDGIYDVYAQIKASALISAATNFGIVILKNNVTTAKSDFANVGVIGVNVTPPVRNAQTLLQLNEGDTITIKTICTLATVDVIGANEDSYFTIHQIR